MNIDVKNYKGRGVFILERTITPEERQRRAEEVYNRRRNNSLSKINYTNENIVKEKVNITLRFNTIENMQQQLKDDLIISDGSNYIAEITIRDDGDNIYNIKINLINNIKNEDITKEMYVYRKI